LRKVSPEMKALIRRVGPCGLLVVARPPFQALVSAIAHQQLHAKAAGNILARLYAIFGGRLPYPEDFAALTEEHFRSVGFSRAKAAALRDLADKCLAGIVPTLEEAAAMPDQELIERISQVRGIGKWTVEMMLMTTLGRQDVWPVDDFGVRAGWKALYGLAVAPTPKQLDAAGEIFRPYRSTAAWYLWRAAELGKTPKLA
ncbi:MAG: DNA-3-methyladenine glycosylase, partial [Akkermansiaceae bacterium]|nr:DNA-3-methyladenine glycosylase [Akkermansiaceae bacterium]